MTETKVWNYETDAQLRQKIQAERTDIEQKHDDVIVTLDYGPKKAKVPRKQIPDIKDGPKGS